MHKPLKVSVDHFKQYKLDQLRPKLAAICCLGCLARDGQGKELVKDPHLLILSYNGASDTLSFLDIYQPEMIKGNVLQAYGPCFGVTSFYLLVSHHQFHMSIINFPFDISDMAAQIFANPFLGTYRWGCKINPNSPNSKLLLMLIFGQADNGQVGLFLLIAAVFINSTKETLSSRALSTLKAALVKVPVCLNVNCSHNRGSV